MNDEYLAHISEDGRKQTLEEHLVETANRCSKFADAFNCSEQGFLLGIAHDIGKSSDAFAERLAGGRIVDHSSAGAYECAARGMEWAAECVAGHHGGLPDFGNSTIDREDSPTLIGRLWRVKKGLVPQYRIPVKIPFTSAPEGCGHDSVTDSFVIRMLYSCLVDADYLDTERFMHNSSVVRSQHDELPALCEKLHEYIAPWSKPKNKLNKLRSSVLEACIDAGCNERGLFSLTVPTGGGKTVSSLAFALEHAVRNGLDRVIYVIPYTSIIEQTADVFRRILGDKNVLEHHSGASIEVPEGAAADNQAKALAAENWDAPVIVTTAVRLFESAFSNRSSACRKLHNIANSVIIFDEAQMLPSPHLRPCTALIAKLVEQFRSTVVLCTATQPVLEPLIREYAPSLHAKELCPNVDELFAVLKRTEVSFAGKISMPDLASRLASHDQVLCIVNSRKAAQEVFSHLPEDGRFHLSTLLFPDHRRTVLKTIRDRLSNGLTCRVVSTSLIEAGVDVDFPAVYREAAGLDSVLQAAGRCNREGKRLPSESRVTVFESEFPVPRILKTNIGCAKEVFASVSDPASPEAIELYFRTLLDLSDNKHDKYNVIGSFEKGISGCRLPFKTVAENFKFIDSATKTVYIPTEGSYKLIGRLRAGDFDKQLYRKLGRYGVGIYEDHFNALLAAGDISLIDDNSAVLENLSLYDEQTGLSLNAETDKCLFD